MLWRLNSARDCEEKASGGASGRSASPQSALVDFCQGGELQKTQEIVFPAAGTISMKRLTRVAPPED